MSPDPDDLPAELDELGASLELAAAAQLARRGAWRRALRKGALSVMVGAPLALGIAAGELAPSAVPVDRMARSGPAAATVASVTTPTRLADRLPDAADAARGWPCVMYPDCRPASSDAPAEPAQVRVEPPRPPMAAAG